MVSHWIDETVFGEGRGLEQVVYYHIHEDGSKHECEVCVPEDLWSGEVGEFNLQMVVTCLSCSAVLSTEDKARFRLDVM